MHHFLWIAVLAALAIPAPAQEGLQDLRPREGWMLHRSEKSFDGLLRDLRAAVREGGLIVVTEAGPTAAAAQRGITIPGNRVIGVFNNTYAVEVLRLSTAAMIEAPIRFYITENDDGTASLSFKTPSYVFSPYMHEGGEALARIAKDLDDTFAEIARNAVD